MPSARLIYGLVFALAAIGPIIVPQEQAFIATAAQLASTEPAPAAARESQGEFSAHGSGVERVELEAKLRVPEEITEEVWEWLQTRYSDCSWLAHGEHEFKATLGNEDFADTYFDTPDLKLLAEQSGVRHRRRLVHSGSAAAKDGRQLLQIKLNRQDPSGLGRTEIKFLVTPPVISRTHRTADAVHPMLGLVDKNELQLCKDQFQELGLDPYSLQPILTVFQNRRRVYVADQLGAFATLTLDKCSTTNWGADQEWTEIELELNEIRYTEADAERRRSMERVVALIQSDLQRQFPEIVQDQTPKYNKSFAAIENSSRLPVRSLIGWGISEAEVVGVTQSAMLLATGLIICGVLWLFRKRWMAPRASAPRTALIWRAGTELKSPPA